MVPLGLKILLGEAVAPQQQERTYSQPKATISDWLTFNGLTQEIVRQLLTDIEPPNDVASAYQNSNAPLDLSADEAWSLCAVALKSTFPELRSEIEMVQTNAPKCLQPKIVKHPKPFTYDLGFGELPFVSLHYHNKPADLIAMAHEFGHALQIIASWTSGEGHMPPVARECCAFMAELAVVHHYESRLPALVMAHRSDDLTYLGTRTLELDAATQDSHATYQYGWNYPIARIAARHFFLLPDKATWFFKAGRSGGQVCREMISVSNKAEVAT